MRSPEDSDLKAQLATELVLRVAMGKPIPQNMLLAMDYFGIRGQLLNTLIEAGECQRSGKPIGQSIDDSDARLGN